MNKMCNLYFVSKENVEKTSIRNILMSWIKERERIEKMSEYVLSLIRLFVCARLSYEYRNWIISVFFPMTRLSRERYGLLQMVANNRSWHLMTCEGRVLL